MKILVTGSRGFIGQWVCGTLESHGHQWVGIDVKPEECEQDRQCNILDRKRVLEIFAQEKPDAVIHLAAVCDLEGNDLAYYDTNIAGVHNLCDAVEATSSVKRAVYTSSQLVCRVGHVPSDDREYCPNTIYGESKVRTEEIVRERNGGGTTWCLARPTTVWGPHMNEHYQSLLHHIKAGHYFHPGGGELYKSYSYAENIAHQYFKLATAPAEAIQGQVFYMADYEPLSLRRYIDGLAEAMSARRVPTMPLPLAKVLAWGGDALNAMGIRFPFNSFRLRNIRTEYIFDMSKTEKICGPLPVDFDTGVKATAEWFMKEIIANS